MDRGCERSIARNVNGRFGEVGDCEWGVSRSRRGVSDVYICSCEIQGAQRDVCRRRRARL